MCRGECVAPARKIRAPSQGDRGPRTAEPWSGADLNARDFRAGPRESNPTGVLIASVVAAAAGLAVAFLALRAGVSGTVGFSVGGGLAVIGAVGVTRTRPHVSSDLILAVLAPVAFYILMLIVLVLTQSALGGFVSD
jgi:hypothetical protein